MATVLLGRLRLRLGARDLMSLVGSSPSGRVRRAFATGVAHSEGHGVRGRGVRRPARDDWRHVGCTPATARARLRRASSDETPRSTPAWQYVCIPQAPRRTEDEEAQYERSLRDVGRWFAHAATHVLLVNTPPSKPQGYQNKRPLSARGWCYWEEHVANLVKFADCIWELSRYGGGETYAALYKQMAARRLPPVSPHALATALRSGARSRALNFAEPSDMELLITLYAEVFDASFEGFMSSFPGRTMLFYSNLGWSDSDAPTLADTFRYISSAVKFQAGRPILHVTAGNRFGAEATGLLWAAVEGSSLRLK